MSIEKEIQRFKIELLRKMPFYGDILMHLVFVEDKSISTAATDGKRIYYNSDFLSTLKQGERNFVLMHELLHVILRHGIRNADRKRDRNIWNTACDIIINDMLSKMAWQIKNADIPFDKPSVGIFASINPDETAENLYEKIKADNESKNKTSKKLKLRLGYTGGSYGQQMREIDIPCDIKTFELSAKELAANDALIQETIRMAARKNRGTMGSYYVPPGIYALVDSKKLNWKRLLKNFLSQELSEDSSYATPERKYLHMDMILPGHTLTEERVDEIWAFVDSSGSVKHDVMSQFLTQLYRIIREFKCVFNICYWDTAVTEVYKKIANEDDILNCLPHHSGGTDINCVYNWISQNKVKPDVMLILTDGYFGSLTTSAFNRKLAKKTILVLSSNININDNIKRIGKIAKL